MKFHGNIELNNNQLQQAALEEEVDFPASPPVGRMIFRQKRVFISTSIDGGDVVWVPLTNVLSTYVHTQTSSSNSWVVTHGLNSATPMVQIYEEGSNTMFIPDNVTINSNNQLTVTMNSATTGRCVVMSGELTGDSPPAYSFVHDQTTLSTSWVINHGLGYTPLVRVFVGNAEVQPLSIVHDSITQATISFSSPTIGVVRFI
jgi:hypothetical protein